METLKDIGSPRRTPTVPRRYLSKDGYDPMGEEEIAQTMGISQQRVSQVLVNLLGASKFTSDKAKVREAIRLYLRK